MRSQLLISISVSLFLLINIVDATSINKDWFCQYGNLERTSTKPVGCMIEKQRLMPLWIIKGTDEDYTNPEPKTGFWRLINSVNKDNYIYSIVRSDTPSEHDVATKTFFLHCTNMGTGEWIFTKPIFSAKTTSSSYIYNLFADEKGIFVNTWFENVRLFDKKNGSLIQTYSLPDKTSKCSPVVYKNNLLIGSINKHFYCLDVNTGDIIWDLDTKGFIQAEIAISGEKIFVAPQNNSSIICLDLNGNQLWKKEFDTDKMGTPVALNDKILVYSNDGYLNCLDKQSGSELWRHKAGSYLMHFSATEENIAIYSLGSVELLDVDNGKVLWKKILPLSNNGKIKTMSNSVIAANEIVNNDCPISIYGDNIFILTSQLWVSEINTGKIKYTFIPKASTLDIWFGYKCIYFKDANDDIICLVDASDTVKFKLGEKEYKTDTRDFTMDVPPQVINGTTYIPAKYVLEPLGGQITWVDKTKTIKSTLLIPGSDELLKNNPDNYVQQFNVLEMKVNSNQAYLNNRQVQIDPKNPKITPIIINGRTMVPLRFLAESLGCKVEWKADTKEIIVTYQP